MTISFNHCQLVLGNAVHFTPYTAVKLTIFKGVNQMQVQFIPLNLLSSYQHLLNWFALGFDKTALMKMLLI